MADLGFIGDLWFDRRGELDERMRLVDLIKASFGGDRSAAGRYAAEQRWKGHVKGEKPQKGKRFTSEKQDEEFRKKYGNERPVGDGDCFQAAVRVMFDVLTEEQRENAYICHGVPMGRGPIEGIRFDHAWVEVVEQPDSDWDDPVVTVYDFSNGSERVIPAFLYYKIGDINPKDVKRYTDKQAYEKMEEKRFYGPWD